ncbi:hypothetical protein [Chitinophaga sp. HK235]|uniref:hypothetical protein n=1 Tax=Chitinophaga sp. HK235 TaxID=2952571 RepID=UPI001BA83F21|nr:hypothetical protein [Chitinophaga sp. HK235]
MNILIVVMGIGTDVNRFFAKINRAAAIRRNNHGTNPISSRQPGKNKGRKG